MALNLFSTIPSQILINENLEPKARLLFGLIGSLTQNEYGYCWATNDYFAEIFQVDVRTVKRWLSSLKAEKVIKVEVAKDGIKTYRKIWICLDFQKMFAKGHFCPPRGDIFVPPPTPSPYIYNNKEENIYIAQQAAPAVAEAPAISSSSSKRKKIPEEKVEVAERVFLTLSQKKSLLKRFNGDEAMYEKCLQRLSTWKIGKSVEGGSDYMSIINWVITAVKSEEVKESQKQVFAENRIRADQMLAEKIWNKCKGRRENDIVISAKYIEFIQGVNSPSIVIEYGSKDFKEKCIEQLKKRKIDLEKL